MINAIRSIMRVIAGKVKGFRIKSLRGSDLRPTSDMLRGAIFSILESLASDWSRVLDLYAGTGALGIEALSRGADWADFVEKNPRLCTLIKENLKNTALIDRSKVYCMSAAKAITVLDKVYDILLLDPPYADPAIASIAQRLSASHLVGKDSTIVIEHSKRTPLEDRLGDFQRVKNVRHGDSCVSVYQYAGGES